MEKRLSIAIFSSGKSIPIAEAIQVNLRGRLNDSLISIIWNQRIFPLGPTGIDNLLKATNEFDFAIFIFGEDDILVNGEDRIFVPRDNVLLELGMFISKIGYKNCFIFIPKESQMKLPTDLAGITYAKFSLGDSNFQTATSSACTQVCDAIEQKGIKFSTWSIYRTDNQHKDSNGKLYLKINDERASAEMKYNKNDAGEDTKRIFRYEGNYENGVLILKFFEQNSISKNTGMIIIKIKSNNKELEGRSVFLHNDKGTITSTEFYGVKNN